jgi:hypothetical protein
MVYKSNIMGKKLLLLGFGAALLSTSCLSELNLDPDSEFTYNGHWEAPIAKVRLNLGDLVVDDSLVYADPDGLVHIFYRNDSLFSQSVYEFTAVPEQEPVTTTFDVSSPPIAVSTTLGTFGGAKMHTLKLKEGNLRWTLTSPVSAPVGIELKVLNTTIGGTPFSLNITTTGQGQTTGIIDVAGLFMDLTQGSPAYNNIGFELTVTNTGGAPSGTDIDLELGFEGLRLGEATGYFGQRLVNVPSGSIATSLGILATIANGLYLDNPLIKLTTKSNIGLPLLLSPDLVAVGNNGSTVSLGLTPLVFSGATSLGTYNVQDFIIDKGNSNISNFIASVPENIIFSGHVEMNPNGEPAANFVTSDGEVTVGLEVDLPLALTTKNVTIEQVLYNIDFGVDENEYDFVEELSLGFRIENGFPLDADLFFYFLDKDGVRLDSAEIALFDAATVDANGKVIAPAKSDRFLDFTQEKIQKILRSDDIEIKVVLNTGNNGQVVKLLTDYYIDVTFGARVKINNFKP